MRIIAVLVAVLFAVVGLAVFLWVSETAVEEPTPTAIDPGRNRAVEFRVPQDQFVQVNGVKLHYLDWGGVF